jgi:hypothetical protein
MPNTQKLIRDRFWWAGMYNQIGDFVRSCHNCQMTNHHTTLRTDGRTLTSTEVDMPLEKVGFDLLGPFPPTTEGYTYLYIWHDHFLRWVGAGPGRTKNLSEVAAFLKMDLFASHLCPRVLVMDNDACVGEVQDLCVAIGTLIMLAAICSPWQNGGAEASVKYLARLMLKLVLQYGGDWAEHLHEALIVVQICFETATRLSPFEIIYGRQPVLPAERRIAQKYQVHFVAGSAGEASTGERLEQALQGLDENCRLNILLRQTHQANLRAVASANRDISQIRAEAAYLRRQHRGVYRVANLRPGQLVIMRKHKREHKLDCGWEGPYYFKYFYDDAGQVAVLEDYSGQRWTRHIVLLHPYQPRAAVEE